MNTETLDKTMSIVHRVEKAICIPMVLICTAIAIADFFCNHYFMGTTLALCAIYWMNMVRIYFMRQKSRVNKP